MHANPMFLFLLFEIILELIYANTFALSQDFSVALFDKSYSLTTDAKRIRSLSKGRKIFVFVITLARVCSFRLDYLDFGIREEIFVRKKRESLREYLVRVFIEG